MHVSCHPLHRLRALFDIAPTCLGYLGCLGCNLLEEFCRIGEWTSLKFIGMIRYRSMLPELRVR